MHLIYQQKISAVPDTKNEFRIAVPQKLQDDIDVNLDMIMEDFSTEDRKFKMKLYFELEIQINNLGIQRSNILKELKIEFKEEFLPEFEEKNPEYFI